jgi:serine O-acetyltransferase
MMKSLREYMASIARRDPAAQSTIEILAAYPGVHAIVSHRVAHALWRWRLRLLARLLSQLARWLTGIEIHPGARIGRRFFIDHGMGVVIGETAEIGDDCTLYHGVTLGGTTWRKGKRHPTLGNNVVIGAGAKVLGPITVGNDARVGSNSVVVKDVPPGATVVGIPGRVIAPRDDEKAAKRKKMAAKIGFDAYGQREDMPDPVAEAVDVMLDHLHAVDQRLETLCRSLKQAGIEVSELPLPELDLPHLRNQDASDPIEKEGKNEEGK